MDLEVVQQIQNMGYESHNALLNLNTMALIILFLVARIALALIFKFMRLACCFQAQWLKRAADFVLGDIFMRGLL